MNIIFKATRYLIRKRNLIKNLVLIALLITTITFSILAVDYKESYDKSVATNNSLNESISNCQVQVKDLETQLDEYIYYMAETDSQIQELQRELAEVEDTAAKLASAQNGTFKADGTYEQAEIVWNFLKDLGLNDYVCAGIIGNIMAEVGGQTLDISRWVIYSQGTYYGVCQWAGSRKERLLRDFGTTLYDQLNFLSVELFEVIPKDNSFYQMNDEQEAALYFAKKYERCNSKYYSVRQKNATKALEYFTR